MRLAFVLILVVLPNASVQSQEAELTVSPNKCVALNKGQVCYQSVLIYFSAAQSGDFCLIVSEQKEPLQCWQATEVAEFRYRFAASRDVEFKMIDANERILAKADVNVAWVYKQSKKRYRWRLF